MTKDLPKQKRRTNKTGVTGVALGSYSCHSYIVNNSGKRISKKFSLAKFGKYEALRLSIKWRRDKELEIHGYTIISEEIVVKNLKHIQSEAKAKNTILLKEFARTERREKIKIKFAKHKNDYQKKEGKYIYRIDDLNLGHGWLLKIEIQGEILYNKIFRDNKYGSVKVALEHAKQARDNQLKLHYIPYARGRRFSNKLRSTNSTGVTGVCRSSFYYHCYIPTKPNKRKTKKISINKYGDELAFQMAIEWRQEMEIMVYGHTVITDSLIKQLTNRDNALKANL